MSTLSRYVERFARHDSTLKCIELFNKQITNSELRELADCLLAHPDVVKRIGLASNQLTDATGVKLARYLAASSTVKFMDLSFNQFGEETYLTVAAALRVNSSLQHLCLSVSQAVDQTHINTSFVDALRINPYCSAKSEWILYSYSNEFKRLKDAADKSTPPSMLEFLLCVHSNFQNFD